MRAFHQKLFLAVLIFSRYTIRFVCSVSGYLSICFSASFDLPMNFPNLPIRFTSASTPAFTDLLILQTVSYALYQPRHNVPRLICCCASVAIGLTCFLFIVAFSALTISRFSSFRVILFRNSIHQIFLLGFFDRFLVSASHRSAFSAYWAFALIPSGMLPIDPFTGCGSAVTPDSLFDPVFLSSSFMNVNDQIQFGILYSRVLLHLSPQEFLPCAEPFRTVETFLSSRYLLRVLSVSLLSD